MKTIRALVLTFLFVAFTAALSAAELAAPAEMAVAICAEGKGFTIAHTESGQRVAIMLPAGTPAPKYGSLIRVRVRPRGEPIQAKSDRGTPEWVPLLELVAPQPAQTGLAGIMAFKVTVDFQAEPGFFAHDFRGAKMFILTTADYRQPAEGSSPVVRVKPTGKTTNGKSGLITEYKLVP